MDAGRALPGILDSHNSKQPTPFSQPSPGSAQENDPFTTRKCIINLTEISTIKPLRKISFCHARRRTNIF